MAYFLIPNPRKDIQDINWPLNNKHMKTTIISLWKIATGIYNALAKQTTKHRKILFKTTQIIRKTNNYEIDL
jgi:hypothetical protein